MLNKKTVRQHFLNKRKALSAKDISRLSEQIITRLQGISEVTSAKDVHVYYPIRNEVDIKPFIEWLWQNDKKVVMPRTNFKNKEMDNYYIISFGQLEETKYGLFEPRVISPRHLGSTDIIIVPGVAFSEDKYRLGYGGGFYDRFLDNSRSIKIGVSFETQMSLTLPVEEHDRKLDLIVTEERIIL